VFNKLTRYSLLKLLAVTYRFILVDNLLDVYLLEAILQIQSRLLSTGTADTYNYM